MSESVELAPEVITALRTMRDAGDTPLRCNKGPIRTAVAAAVRALNEDSLGSKVRPWHLSALRRRAAELGASTAAVAVHVAREVLVAELLPSRQRVVLRGVDDSWQLVRFLDAHEVTGDIRLLPETTQEITLDGFSPDAVLTALGIARPDDVELDVESEDLGQGETQTVHRYLFTDAGRSVLAEEVKTPSWTRLRGLVIEDGRGALVTANQDGAQLIQG